MLLRFINFPPLLLKSETYFLEMKYKYSLTYIHCITDDDGDDVFFRTFEQIIKFPCTMFKFKCDYKFSGGVSLPLLVTTLSILLIEFPFSYSKTHSSRFFFKFS